MKKKWTGQILNHSVGIWPCGHSLDVRTSPPAETIGHLWQLIIIKNDNNYEENLFIRRNERIPAADGIPVRQRVGQ